MGILIWRIGERVREDCISDHMTLPAGSRLSTSTISDISHTHMHRLTTDRRSTPRTCHNTLQATIAIHLDSWREEF